jgi:hypothetical protein
LLIKVVIASIEDQRETIASAKHQLSLSVVSGAWLTLRLEKEDLEKDHRRKETEEMPL